MSTTDNHTGQTWINQIVSGENNQVAGRDIIIHPRPDQSPQPSPDNPNLITCPACGKFGVFRGADLCPACHYSFLNVRMAEQEKTRRQQKEGLTILTVLALGVLVSSELIFYKLEVGILSSLAWGVVTVLTIYTLWLFVLSKFATWLKLR